jgi:hypothetical protein
MNEITPPKLMPPDQSRLASGMLPIEQTKDAMAMITPTAQFSTTRRAAGAVSGRKRTFHHWSGTAAMRKPAMRKPMTISFHIMVTSIRNASATAAQDFGSRSFDAKEWRPPAWLPWSWTSPPWQQLPSSSASP